MPNLLVSLYKMKTRPIGILGGTFDPIHLGHIHLATTVYKLCDLQKVLLIPCYQSPLKPSPIASAKDRWHMVKLASKSIKYLKAINYEIKQATPSYTVKTLEYLHRKNSTTPLALIMGIDAFNQFDQWHKWQKILNLAHLIIVNRLGCNNITKKKMLAILSPRQIFTPKDLPKKLAGFIYFIDIKPLPISAIAIRKLIKQKKDIRNLVMPQIWQYINKNRLYSYKINTKKTIKR